MPRGGSNCSIRVRTAVVGVRGGGSSSSSRVRVNPGGFELFDTSLNWHCTSASEGMGGGSSSSRSSSRSGGFLFWAGGGGVRVRVRGFVQPVAV